MLTKYVLDERRNVVPTRDLMRWARWLETSGERRRVAYTRVGRATVSTVFLSLDHNFLGGGPPLLFETLVRGSDNEGEGLWRWSTWEEAAAGHHVVVADLRARTPWWARALGRGAEFWWRLQRYEWDWAARRWAVA